MPAKTAISQSYTTTSSYKKTTLANGLRVISEEIPFVKSVSIGVWVDTGTQNETKHNNGISHFVEHMVFKGTKKYSFQEIAKSLESVGGYLNAFTTKEHTCYYAHVLDEYAEKSVDVLSELVQYPTFPEKEILKEKQVVLEELKNSEDEPEEYLHDTFEQHLYPSHPLGFSILGTAETIAQFSQKELRSYFTQYYKPKNFVIAAAGNISHEKLITLVEKYFSSKKNPSSSSTENFSVPHPPSSRKEIHKPFQQAHTCIGKTIFTIHHPQRYSALVLNAFLGDGMSSRLFQSVREKYGLVYTIYSFINLFEKSGTFGVYFATDKKNQHKAIEIVKKELQRCLQQPLKKSELQRTQSQLKGNMMLSLENTTNRMMRLGSGELYFGEFTTLESIIKNIDDVTLESVYNVAQILCNEKDYTEVIFLPK